MLSGDQCNLVLNHYKWIINGVASDTHFKYEQLFKLLNNIIIIIEMKQDDSDESQILTNEKIILLEKLIIEFLNISYSIWARGVKSHYFHFIIHLPLMMNRLKEMELSLALISNQGFERSHLSHHAVFTRIMNNGGGRISNPITKQLIQWQWRKVELAIDLHERTGRTFWGEKKIRNRNQWPDDKKVCSSNSLKFDSSVSYDKNGNFSTLIESIKAIIYRAEEEEKKRIEESTKKRTVDVSSNLDFIQSSKKKKKKEIRKKKLYQ